MNPLRLKRPGNPEPLSETAADWVLRAEEGLSEAEEQRLADWLSRPEHVQAFDDAVWALDSVQSHAAAPEILTMREAALAKAPERSSNRLALAMSGIAAAAAGALLWLGGVISPLNEPVGPEATNIVSPSIDNGVYRTGIGERSAAVLPDGSLVTLDTDTELKVAYSREERGVILGKGQALFEVAEGKPRPFRVYAGDQHITAVGTIFNVKLDGPQVRVSMVEGVVNVRRSQPNHRGGPIQELTLRAGESLVSHSARPTRVQAVDTSRIAAWRGGLLVFDDEKLSTAIAEINRYTDKPIRLGDAFVGEYRVTGVFKTSDPTHFAKAMSEVFPVEAERHSDGSTVLKAER